MKKLLFLHSYNRSNGTISNAIYNIPPSYITCKENEHIKLTITDFISKKNFYNIQNYNNKMYVIEDGINTIQITFPNSSPNYRDVMNYIVSTLNSSSSLYVYSCVFNSQTLKYTFTANPTGSVGNICFKFSDNPCNNIVGFDSDSENYFDAGTTSLILTSSNIIDVGGEEAIYLKINNIDAKNMDDGELTNVIARIPILVDTGGTIFYNNLTDDYGIDISAKQLTVLNIEIVNDEYKEIEFQSDYTISIKIEIIDDSKDNSIVETLTNTNDYLKLLLLNSKYGSSLTK